MDFLVKLLIDFKYAIPALSFILIFTLFFSKQLGIKLSRGMILDLLVYILSTFILGSVLSLLFWLAVFFGGEGVLFWPYSIAAIILAPIFYHFLRKTPQK